MLVSLAQQLITVRNYLWQWTMRLGARNAQRSDERLTLAYWLLYDDLGETVVLMELIDAIQTELDAIQTKLDTRWKTLSQTRNSDGLRGRTIEPQSAEGQLYARQSTLLNEVQVLIKAVYEWFYHLSEDIERHPELKAAVPQELQRRLDVYCTFRRHLVTHKESLQQAPGPVIRWSAGFRNIELVLIPYNPLVPATAAELKRLIAAVRPYLSADNPVDDNQVTQIETLYAHLGHLPNDRGDLKADIKRFIREHGAVSDGPEVLADFLVQLTSVLIPPRTSSSLTSA